MNAGTTIHADTPAARMRAARESLIADFSAQGRTFDFLTCHTALLDDYFISCFESSRVGPKMNFHKHPFAVIALGGYGRQEMCIHSDIDLLFLFKKQVPPAAEALIREMVYPLWDMGFEVGHATRSVKECQVLAGDDLDVLTSLLDSRFLCGMLPLHTQLRERLAPGLSGCRARNVIAALIQGNQERHRKFGDSSYLLEPNLKEGVGGLRDYHSMLWIARIISPIISPRDLEYYGYLSHDEYADLNKALAFIWTVRNHLHGLAGRKYDQLYLDHQEVIATAMGFKPGGGARWRWSGSWDGCTARWNTFGTPTGLFWPRPAMPGATGSREKPGSGSRWRRASRSTGTCLPLRHRRPFFPGLTCCSIFLNRAPA